MIPLVYFLFAWFAALAIFAVMSMLSVIQMVRFGIAGSGTFLSTLLFMCTAVLVILGTSAYLLHTDWSQGVDLFGGLTASPIFTL